MRKVKINKERNEIKEKAFSELNKGKFTQRELAIKYDIHESELSRFFSQKYKSSGYPQLTYQEK